ncbi:MAG: UDP-2,4-diacetamido-2,4,6-trideoxy-beta-L-altropyranose hydrolase [Bacteroidales bacterium]|nr:UDP-2,4-diacetamido-2,4,6-trideoxy-beta-L-altropyranose hydrolase [Bacteroidales bacterium]
MNSKPKIILRGDGNSEIGLGHLYRLLALAEMLKEDFNILFLTHTSSETKPIISAGFKVQTIDKSIDLHQEAYWIKTKFLDTSIIILDGYHFDEQYQKSLKMNGLKIAYIDDLMQGKVQANVIINHAPYAKKMLYNAGTNTTFALGLDYAILRPAFLKASQQKTIEDRKNNVFVSFGGADPNNYTLLVCQALIGFSQIENIHVVIGASAKNKLVENLAIDYPQIKIHKNLNATEMLKLMQVSNLAIVPSSNILFELLAVKTKILSGYYVENQKYIYDSFLKRNVIFPLGDLTKINVESLKLSILESIKSDNSIIDRQAQLFTSDVKKNYIELIKTLC